MPGESSQLLDTLAKSTCGSCGITCEPGTQDISLCAARDISEIHINAGDLVDRIEIRYRDGTSAIHGAKGGNKMKPFLFKPGEKLVRISVRAATRRSVRSSVIVAGPWWCWSMR